MRVCLARGCQLRRDVRGHAARGVEHDLRLPRLNSLPLSHALQTRLQRRGLRPIDREASTIHRPLKEWKRYGQACRPVRHIGPQSARVVDGPVDIRAARARRQCAIEEDARPKREARRFASHLRGFRRLGGGNDCGVRDGLLVGGTGRRRFGRQQATRIERHLKVYLPHRLRDRELGNGEQLLRGHELVPGGRQLRIDPRLIDTGLQLGIDLRFHRLI